MKSERLIAVTNALKVKGEEHVESNLAAGKRIFDFKAVINVTHRE